MEIIAQHSWCISAEKHSEMIAIDPEIAAEYQKFQQQLEFFQKGVRGQRRALITIPVVVHVVHDGDAIGQNENISDAQIHSQIEVLNEDFRRLNPDASQTPAVFQLVAADLEIEFCLAAKDPNGLPTNGINRINGNRSIWNINLADQFKPGTIWDPSRYLNIWVLRLGGTNQGTLGYAQFPWMPDSTDGIVVETKAFGTNGDLLPTHTKGRTLTHEVGHWLGLRHIWGDANDCIADDNVADTPLQATENYGCPTFPSISCNNGPNGDMFMNFMDYSDDECSNLFTIGQKNVVGGFFSMSGRRQDILSSDACVPTTVNARDVAVLELFFPTTQICTESFLPSLKLMNLGSATVTSLTINYQIDNGALQQFQWSGQIESLHTSFVNLPLQTLNLGMHEIYIFIGGVNGASDQNQLNNDVTLEFEISGIGVGEPFPVSEDFETTALPHLWATINPGSDRTWILDTASGAMMFDNFSTGSGNPVGKRDQLVTASYDFRSIVFPQLEFDVAYAQRVSSSKDSLILYYSLDCGNSWIRAWASGGAELATTAPQLQSFTPQATEWKTVGVNVFPAQGHLKVMFMFENYSDGGNNLYVDNFKINMVTTAVNEIEKEKWVSVFPNPSNGIINVRFNLPVNENVKLEVFNSEGKNIFSTENIPSFIDLSDAGKGLYLLKIVSGKNQQTEKILLN